MTQQRIVYQQIASSLDAMRNCQAHHAEPGKAHLTEWIDKHEERALTLTRDYLPSGSGFDCGTTLNVDASRDNKLVFETSFHHMDESGGYDSWTEHTITVRPSLTFTLDITVSGRDRNDIKDYIHEAFYMALRTTFEN